MQPFIEVDITRGIKKLDNLEKKQLPFAMAKALTDTANDARDHYVDNILGQKYTLRGKWYKARTRFGFNVKKATKHDLTAVVYTRADWMRLHEKGGIKKPQSTHLAIPTELIRRSKKTGKISKAMRPKQVMASGKGFIANKGGQKMIMRRRTKKIVEPIYLLERQARIKPTMDFKRSITSVVRRKFPWQFNRAMRYAMATAR